MRTLRIPGETDDEFRERAKRAHTVARILVHACLDNDHVKDLLADGVYHIDELQRSPIIRLDFDQAYAIGCLGEMMDATKSKSWGDGPYVLPLEPDDMFFSDRITFVYKENSLYNRRFEQRRRLKELLGENRSLVEHAKHRLTTKSRFLTELSNAQRQAIARLGIDAGDFWRACKGKLFLELPPRLVQKSLFD